MLLGLPYWLILVLPLAGSLLVPVVGRFSERLRDWTPAIFMGIAMVLCWSLLPEIGHPTQQTSWTWIEVLGLNFEVLLDPLSVVMGVLASTLCFLIYVYSTEYMAHEEDRDRFFFLMLAFGGGIGWGGAPPQAGPSVRLQLADLGLDRSQKLEVGHGLHHGVVIAIERPVHVEELDVPAHLGAGGAGAPTRRVVAEVQALGRGHDLDAEHAAGHVQDLAGLERRVPAHGHEVLLVCGGRDGLDVGGGAQDLLFDDQSVGGVLAQHQPREHASALGEEGGKLHAEGRVEQAVQASF